MKKRGFTLVELIAVIAVLGVILAIAVPIITGVIQNSTKKSFVSDAKMVLKALDLEKTNDKHFDQTIVTKSNIYSLLGISSENYSSVEILMDEDLPFVKIVGSGKWNGLIVCGTEDNIDIVTDVTKCVIDHEAPVITITGSNPTSININATYTDAGATATDDVDGNITSKIVATSNVNISAPGSYIVTYKVTDEAGNVGTATRTVNVIDNVGPTIVINPSSSTTYTKSKSVVVTVTDISGVNDSTLVYSFSTGNVTPPPANVFNKPFTNGGTITLSTGTGIYYLWAKAYDSLGNVRTAHTTGAFYVDNTAPVITVTGTNPVSINVGSTYTDAGATATDADSGLNGTVASSSNVNPSVPGSYTVTYNVSDNAGNAAIPAVRTVNVTDSIAPTVAFGTNGNSTYAKTSSTTVTASDNVSVNTSSLKYLWNTSTTAPAEASITTSFTNGGTINTPAGVTGSYYLWILGKDTSGNTTITGSNAFNLDNTPPVLTITGSNPVSINVGSTYTDAGATATDSQSGINGTIATSSNVNPNVPGAYYVAYNVSDKAGNSSGLTRTVNVINTDYIASKGVNKPKLATGMTPIKWDASGNVVTTTESDNDWYDYPNKKWANAQTADGSMWVWIPRYEYKIPTPHSSTAQTILINFLVDRSTTATSGYTVHPTFTFGTNELTGIWVAKFEASAPVNDSCYTISSSLCNYTSPSVKSVPNVVAWRGIYIGYAFSACRNMETNSYYGWGTTGTNIDTHLIKNIEWGAVTYLSNSAYGKNSQVYMNTSSQMITGKVGTDLMGGAGDDVYEYVYNTSTGALGSTSGTVYGVYDMAGGSWEYTAAYVDNAAAITERTTYASALFSAADKYKDKYSYTSGANATDIYNLNASKKGDAVYEISASTSPYDETAATSWYGDYSVMPRDYSIFFMRSASFVFQDASQGRAGIFAFFDDAGGGNTAVSFRPAITVDTGL